jgi:hypothetical protein
MRARQAWRRPVSDPIAGRALYREVRCQDARMGLGRSVLFRLATSERLERAVKRVPGGDLAAWRAASRYVAGSSRSGALATSRCCSNAVTGSASTCSGNA